MKDSTKPALYGILSVILVLTFFRPLPENFTDSRLDRIVMHFMETVLRFSYVYPSRLCPTAYCELVWTRAVLEKLQFLQSLVGISKPLDPGVESKMIDLDSVSTRVYVPTNRSNDGAIIFIHGGGFVLGNIKIYNSMVHQIARDSGMLIFSLDYRLAPEHVFPAGLDDCERAYVHVVNRIHHQYGINRERVVLMGDSAGAALIAALTFRLRNRTDIPQPKQQVLIYPLLQVHNFRTPSYEYFYREMKGTAFVDPRLVAQYYLMYGGIDDRTNAKLVPCVLDNKHLSPTNRQVFNQLMEVDQLPDYLKYGRNVTEWDELYDEEAAKLLSPLLHNPEFTPIVQTDLSGVPPALVVTMEFDVLRDEGVLYAQRLQRAGIPTTWKHFSTGFHAMFNFHDNVQTAERVMKWISHWTRDNV